MPALLYFMSLWCFLCLPTYAPTVSIIILSASYFHFELEKRTFNDVRKILNYFNPLTVFGRLSDKWKYLADLREAGRIDDENTEAQVSI